VRPRTFLVLLALLCIGGAARAGTPGDLDGSGKVDERDLGLFMANWRAAHQPAGPVAPDSDLDGDDDIDQADAKALLELFLSDPGTGRLPHGLRGPTVLRSMLSKPSLNAGDSGRRR